MRVLVLLALVLTNAPHTSEQASEPLTATEPFSLWPGDWKGNGWSLSPTGVRTEFELSESVRERVAGSVLLVEGHGTRTSGAEKGRPSHDGLVLVYRDSGGGLRWNGHEAAQGTIDTALSASGRTFTWSFRAATSPAIVRFSITLDRAEWHETGEVSADGTTWTRFMEMTLKKVDQR